MLESEFQSTLIRTIKRLWPDAFVLKNDTTYIQGFPDLTVIIGPYAFVLEVKASRTASVRPNQTWYVNSINECGGFARFIFPENKEDVLNEIHETLSA